MSTDLTPYSVTLNEVLSPEGVKSRISYAKALAASQLNNPMYRDPANVFSAIATAEMLGVHPMAAIQGVNIIQGKPTLSAALMSGLVRRAGHKLRIIEDTERQTVTAILIRSDDPDFEFKSVWTREKAQQAGLMRGQNWQKYPLQMMRNRAISEVCRAGAAEVFSMAPYTAEELEGDVIDAGEAAVHPQPPQQAPQQRPVQQRSTEPLVRPDGRPQSPAEQPPAEEDPSLFGDAFGPGEIVDAEVVDETSQQDAWAADVLNRFTSKYGSDPAALLTEYRQLGGPEGDADALTRYLTTKARAYERQNGNNNGF